MKAALIEASSIVREIPLDGRLFQPRDTRQLRLQLHSGIQTGPQDAEKGLWTSVGSQEVRMNKVAIRAG